MSDAAEMEKTPAPVADPRDEMLEAYKTALRSMQNRIQAYAATVNDFVSANVELKAQLNAANAELKAMQNVPAL